VPHPVWTFGVDSECPDDSNAGDSEGEVDSNAGDSWDESDVDSNDELFPLDNEGEPSFPMTQVIFRSYFEL